ncbi:MAG: chemotaxis protein CheB [Lysobacterales bacterium]
MKIGIAHPDRLTREALRRSLATIELSACWTVNDARDLDRANRRDPADLVLLALSLVGANGSQVRGLIEDGCACLVLSDGNEAAPAIYDALSAGALGHVQQPQLEADGTLSGAARLCTRIQRMRGLIGRPQATPLPIRPARTGDVPILALGASTGGPQALATVLRGLPANLPAAVLIVQHIDAEFSEGLVEWLSTNSALPVQAARRGDLIESGRVYVAGHEGHLVLLASQQFGYLAALKADLHVPSIDMLFSNLAGLPRPGVAALLTGMGADGAAGLLKLRQAGWQTVAQDEASSVVYGMPRAAAELNAAQQVLPLNAISAALVRACMNGARR